MAMPYTPVSLVWCMRHLYRTYSKSTLSFLPVDTTRRLCLGIMGGWEWVLVLCWGISWGGHSGRCFGRHFPCRHSSTDLDEVVLSRADSASVASRAAGGACRAHFPSHWAIHPMGRLGGALSGPASGSESGIVSCSCHRAQKNRMFKSRFVWRKMCERVRQLQTKSLETITH